MTLTLTDAKEPTCTAKQEFFAQEFVKNGKPSEAYRLAYNARKMGNQAVAVEAYRVRTTPNVASRIEQIRADLDEQYSVAKVTNAIKLDKLIDANLPNDACSVEENALKDHGIAIAAIKEQNKMYGHLAPTRNEHTGKNGGPMKTQIQKVIRMSTQSPNESKPSD